MFMNYWFESDKKGLPGNRSFYANPQVDALLKQAVATTDQTERTRDYQAAQKPLSMRPPTSICSRRTTVAMNKEVKGFVFNPMLEQIFNIADMHK